MAAPNIRCDLCERMVPVHESYVVRIELFADPNVPEVTAEELATTDYEQSMADLLKQMEQMSTQEIESDVHRRFEFRLCVECQRRFVQNPLAKPKRVSATQN